MKNINILISVLVIAFGISCKGPDAKEVANEACGCYESIIGSNLFTKEDAAYHIDSCEKLIVLKYNTDTDDKLRKEIALNERQINQSKEKVEQAYLTQINDISVRISNVYNEVLDANPYITNGLYVNLSDSIEGLVSNWYEKKASHEVIANAFNSDSVNMAKAKFLDRYKMQPTEFKSLLHLMSQGGDMLYSPNDERILFHMFILGADVYATDAYGFAAWTNTNGEYLIGMEKNEYNMGEFVQMDAEYSIICHDFGGEIDISAENNEVLLVGTFKRIEQKNWGEINIAHMENCELIGVYFDQEISKKFLNPMDEYLKHKEKAKPILNNLSNKDVSSTEDETTTTAKTSNNECDEFLDGYEEFMEDYIKIIKKFKDNPSDMNLLTDYTKIMTEASAWSSKQPDCSDEVFLKRYVDIQTKIANAISDINSTSETNDKNVVANKNESTSAKSIECDEFLDGYEKFMDEYIELIKKYQKNPTDMTLLTDYTSMMTKSSEWISKKPDCSDEEFLNRYAQIQAKIAKAISDM